MPNDFVKAAFIAGWNELAKEACATATKNGFTKNLVPDSTRIALIHSELSEALEAMRDPDQKDNHLPDEHPVALELADAVIRIMDMAEKNGYNMAEVIIKKIEYNAKRPYRHGGKLF